MKKSKQSEGAGTNLPIGSHPNDDAFERYAIGNLPESELERFEAHLLACEACQDKLNEADEYVATMGEALAKANAEPAWLNRTLGSVPRWAVAAAAAVVLAAVATVQVRSSAPVAPVAVALEAQRGELTGARGPAGKPLRLAMNTAELPSSARYDLEVVDAHGSSVLSGQVRPEQGRAAMELPKLPAGVYWVRLHQPGTHELLREFGLLIE